MQIEILGAKFKFRARDVHPTISQARCSTTPGITTLRAHRHSGREISKFWPEMCTPLFLRPKSKPAGREKPIRVAPIRVVTKYPIYSVSELRRPCFRQTLVAQAVLLPSDLFHAETFAFPPCPQVPLVPTPTFGSGKSLKGGALTLGLSNGGSRVAVHNCPR